jgi:hypothetical protein
MSCPTPYTRACPLCKRRVKVCNDRYSEHHKKPTSCADVPQLFDATTDGTHSLNCRELQCRNFTYRFALFAQMETCNFLKIYRYNN